MTDVLVKKFIVKTKVLMVNHFRVALLILGLSAPHFYFLLRKYCFKLMSYIALY